MAGQNVLMPGATVTNATEAMGARLLLLSIGCTITVSQSLESRIFASSKIQKCEETNCAGRQVDWRIREVP